MKNKGITFYVAECMEFKMGEYYDNIKTIDEAVELYNSIPSERLNGGKGIGFMLGDDIEFNLLSNDCIDVGLIHCLGYDENPLVQKAIEDISKYFPDKVV